MLCIGQLDDMRIRVLGRQKFLKWLNGEPVTENEMAMALRVFAGSCISQLSLLTNSRMDTVMPRSLAIGSGAHIITTYSRLKPDKVSDADISWYSKVSVINNCLIYMHG